MKKKDEKSMQFTKTIVELKDGKLEGGFEFIAHSQLTSILAGANNCEGGNCIAGCGTTNTGCGTNTVSGCSGPNTISGCGTPSPNNG